MFKSLYTSATGMRAQQLNVDVIANNLANINTTGFKKSQCSFEDLLYIITTAPGAVSAEGYEIPTGVQIGSGSRLVATEKIFTPGVLEPTGNMLDVAVEGDGFFKILMPDGSYAYTRDGSFKLSRDGSLVTSQGYLLDGIGTLDPDTLSVSIGKDGTVTSVTASSPETSKNLGQIMLTRFPNPSGLTSLGGNLFKESATSGTSLEVTPGEEGSGTMMQGFLERSNVDVVQELVNLIIAQRAYEVNSRAIRTGDDMLSIANRLTR